MKKDELTDQQIEDFAKFNTVSVCGALEANGIGLTVEGFIYLKEATEKDIKQHGSIEKSIAEYDKVIRKHKP